jgi:hypothetical protein
LNGAQYQQRFKNQKRAHRRVPRNFVQFVIFALNSSLTKIPGRIIANAISIASTPDVVS